MYVNSATDPGQVQGMPGQMQQMAGAPMMGQMMAQQAPGQMMQQAAGQMPPQAQQPAHMAPQSQMLQQQQQPGGQPPGMQMRPMGMQSLTRNDEMMLQQQHQMQVLYLTNT